MHGLLVAFSSNEWNNRRRVKSVMGLKMNRVRWRWNCGFDLVVSDWGLRLWDVWIGVFLVVLHLFFSLPAGTALHKTFLFESRSEALTFSKLCTTVFEPHLKKHVALISNPCLSHPSLDMDALMLRQIIMWLSPGCGPLGGWCRLPASLSYTHLDTAFAERPFPALVTVTHWRPSGCGAAFVGSHIEPQEWALNVHNNSELIVKTGYPYRCWA